MNHKKRVVTTLNHHQPDKVPVDYWSVPEVDKILLKKFQLKNKEELLTQIQQSRLFSMKNSFFTF